MKVLVAFEFSGSTRNAFLARGHDAWSCDLLPAEDGSNRHIRADFRDLLGQGWDLLMVAHPPCTRLCNSGVRWLSAPPPGRTEADMQGELVDAADMFSTAWNAPIERVCIENPVMHRYAKALISDYQPPAQSIQPWQFGHGETKRTCLWLRNLPLLQPTNIVEGREARIHRMPGGKNQARERSRSYRGISAAMAQQWGDLDGLTVEIRERIGLAA